MRKIVITVADLKLSAELNDSNTAQRIWDALPLQGTVNTWGDEIYFEIPVEVDQAPDARAEVEVGTLGYWPVGKALCIFFGPTPASSGSKPRAYSPVNIIGEMRDDATELRSVEHGAQIRVARAKV
ncbi:MAG: cyclophilin-like fold protein [Anaerolineae bacterium]